MLGKAAQCHQTLSWVMSPCKVHFEELSWVAVMASPRSRGRAASGRGRAGSGSWDVQRRDQKAPRPWGGGWLLRIHGTELQDEGWWRGQGGARVREASRQKENPKCVTCLLQVGRWGCFIPDIFHRILQATQGDQIVPEQVPLLPKPFCCRDTGEANTVLGRVLLSCLLQP